MWRVPFRVRVFNDQENAASGLCRDNMQYVFAWVCMMIAARPFIKRRSNTNHHRSKSVVRLLETQVIATKGKGEREILLFYPLFTKGSLQSLLLDQRRVELNERAVLELFWCCADAIEAIHTAGVAHCDVKTLNFMLTDDEKKCVLIDFGSARSPTGINVQDKMQAMVEQERAERCTSAAYRAPELWDVHYRGDEALLDFTKVDIFSLGCVLYAMTFAPFGYSPFESSTQGLMALAARTAEFTIPVVRKQDSIRGSDELIKSMLQRNPRARPTAVNVRKKLDELLKEIQEEDFDCDFQTQ